MGLILDAEDLRPQFVAARQYFGLGGDTETISNTTETRWQAMDLDADTDPDLRVREETHNTDEDLTTGETTRRDDSQTAQCLYDPAGDWWVCDKRLGLAFTRGDASHAVIYADLAVPEPRPRDGAGDGASRDAG